MRADNKKTRNGLLIGAVLFFISLGIAIPLFPAQAFWAEIGQTFYNIFFGTIFQILAIIGNVFLGIAAGLMSWVISPDFTSLSYTNPAGNPILQIGWSLTRDLANAGIILVLVVIGLATILRLEEYHVKKTLPKLIIIALLINFTPVIIGLIVDAGNILMNFFISDLTGWDSFSRALEAQWGLIVKITTTTKPWEDNGLVGASLGMAAFGFFGGLILFVYSILFAMRYVAIWILVIISPVAFLAYILPATKSLFNQWWNQLLQWSFIGAIAGFFLYLSNYIIYLTNCYNGIITCDAADKINIINKNPGAAIGGGSIDQLLPYFIVISFLYIGFFVALSTSAMGASGVIAWTQNTAKAAPAWVARRRSIQQALGKTSQAGAETLARLDKRLEKAGTLAKPIRWALRPATAAAPYLYEYATKKRKVSVSETFDKMSPIEQAKYVETMHPSSEDRLQYVSRMAEKGTLKNTPKDFQQKATDVANQWAGSYNYKGEAGEIYNVSPEKMTADTKVKMKIAFKTDPAERAKAKQEAENELNELSQKIATDATFDKELEKEINAKITPNYSKAQIIKDMAAVRLHVKSMSPNDIKKMANADSPEIVRGLVNFGSTPQISTAGKEHGEDFIKKFMEEADKKGLRWFEENRKSVLTYLKKTPAQELGFREPKLLGQQIPAQGPLAGSAGPATPPPASSYRPRGRPGPSGTPLSGGEPPKGRPGLGVASPIKRRIPRGRSGIGRSPTKPSDAIEFEKKDDGTFGQKQ